MSADSSTSPSNEAPEAKIELAEDDALIAEINATTEPAEGLNPSVDYRKPLGDRMKEMENVGLQYIDPKLPWMVRLDGHKFSGFTSKFKRPFDDRVHNCMVAACRALLIEFQPSMAFTCSDEITLIFPSFESTITKPETGEDNRGMTMFYGGRIVKIATLMSSLAGIAFDREMQKQVFDEATEAKLIENVKNKVPFFDARVFNVPNAWDIVSNLIWRSHYDYRRNSISQYARQYYSTKQMHKINSHQLVEMMKTEHGFDWHQSPPRYRFGVMLKRQNFLKKVTYNGREIEAKRTRTVELSFEINKNSPEMQEFVMSKMLPVEYESQVLVYHEEPEVKK